MTTSIGEMLAQLRAAEEHLDGLASNLRHERERLSVTVDKGLLRLGDAEFAGEQRAMELMGARVDAALAARRYDTLSSREARFAMRMWDRHAPAVIDEVMRRHPHARTPFAVDCLRRWDDFDDRLTVAFRDAYRRLLAEAVKLPGPLSTVPPEVAPIGSDGPKQLAAALGDRRSLLETFDVLTTHVELRPGWAYTAQVLAFVAAQTPGRAREHWDAVRAQAQLEAMLLPEAAERISWFSGTTLPLVNASLQARAVFVATLLRSPALDENMREVLVEHLMRSSFRDPRLPPESLGWRKLREYDAGSYSAFLERLVREDLTLFFDHAMSDTARGKFWLRYLGSIRRTVCVMGALVARELKARLAGGSSGAKAALDRVRRFSTSRGASAFCLYFDDYVVVEFSETGHAAYVYPRAEFERRFEAALSADGLRAPGDLKDAGKAAGKIIHMPRWESDASELLSGMGIRQSTARKSVAPAVMTPVVAVRPPSGVSPIASAPVRGSNVSPSVSRSLPAQARVGGASRSSSSVIAAMARGAGLEVVDHTDVGGALWIVGGESLAVWFQSRGVDAKFSPAGGKSTGGRPSWYVKPG